MSRPPRADKLLDLATRSQFPVPQWLEIHTGANDEGCDPDLAKKIGDLIEGTKVSIIPDQGHALPNAYIKEALHRFFADEAHAVRIRD